MQTTQIRLAARPVGEPADTDFDTVTVDLPALEDGQLLLRVRWLSLDPYMRGRMSAARSYAAPLEIGDVVLGGTVGEVVESRDPDFSPGDLVLSFSGWQTMQVTTGAHVRKLPPSDLPSSTALGVLGMPGFTAYAGLLEIGKPVAGETVVVAAAAGPVGSAVGQIARIRGARAVGIAGGAEKCRLLTEEFGFDAAIDHRSSGFDEELKAATPDGVDVYFENVGGPVGAAVVRRMNTYGRIPLCGLVANYNATGPVSGADQLPDFLGLVLSRSLTMRGFIQGEFAKPDLLEAFGAEMGAWIADGSVKYREDVVDGLENAVEAFRGLLSGRNVGKLLVRIS